MDDYLALGTLIGNMVVQERPARILEIGEGGSAYGHLLKACQGSCGIKDGTVDRIPLPGTPPPGDGGVYRRVWRDEWLERPALPQPYDVVLIIDLMERLPPDRMRTLLEALQYQITGQILLIVPVDAGQGGRSYHPVFFLGLDFSYSLVPGTAKPTQAYSVFPKIGYGAMRMDHPTMPETPEQMHIAFALSHHALTGGMKALLQQVRHLQRNGHRVSVYFRRDNAKSAIPPWSDLTDGEYEKQVVVPPSERLIDHMQGEEVVILSGIEQAVQFLTAEIPVVLWEQGSGPMFGDFGKPLCSKAGQRRALHSLYRLPIHLLAVSDVIATALKGIYNRDAFVYPCGVDTQLYHPGKKQNSTPVILLTGHPGLAFKGFRFAFEALNRAYADGFRFEVKWAAQVEVIHGPTNFPLEVIVSPRQHELAELYRQADIFLSTSLYESYSLPPLEAMASGTAVVATDCGGIRTYAKHGENCLLCRQGDLHAVISALETLLRHPDERGRLAGAGRDTAIRHSADTVIRILERRLFGIVQADRANRGEK